MSSKSAKAQNPTAVVEDPEEPDSPVDDEDGVDHEHSVAGVNYEYRGQHFSLSLDQNDHVGKLQNIAEAGRFVFDRSQPGLGKTWTTAALCTVNNAAVLHIGPASSLHHSKEVYKRTGVICVDIYSFETFTGTRSTPLSHGWMTRDDYTEVVDHKGEIKEVHRYEYHLTPKFKEYIKYGYPVSATERVPFFVVIDEAHKLKNDNQTSKAVQTISLFVLSPEARDISLTRLLLLSGSLADDARNAVNILSSMGVVTAGRLYKSAGRGNIEMYDAMNNPYGLQQVIDFGKSLDEAATQAIFADYNITSETVNNCIFDIFAKVILPRFSAAMKPLPEDHLFLYNAYLEMTDSEFASLMAAGTRLATAAGFNEKTGKVGSKQNWAEITKALQDSESAKINAIIRQAHHILKTVPKSKVVIQVNYLESIQRMQDYFAEVYKQTKDIGYTTMVLTGKVSKKNRIERQEIFNLGSSRILLGIMSVAGQSISLDDTVGNSPRYEFLIPSYYYSRQIQAARRIFRRNTKSNATVYTVWGRHGAERASEARIIDALAKKHESYIKIMPELLAIQKEAVTIDLSTNWVGGVWQLGN